MGRIKVKMELEFWYDPETNEYEAISSKVLEDKKSKKPSKREVSNDSEPSITLESNKLVLNDKAIELLGAEPDDRIHIQYKKVDGIMYPLIAKSDVLGISSGNKLTKSNTISFRGKANDKLSEYGDVFSLKEKSEGIYIMMGNKEMPVEESIDPNIQVEAQHEDDLEKELEDTFTEDDGAVEIDFSDLTL